MQTSETIKSILPAMLKVQEEMEALAKDRENPFANSKYVTLDNILHHLKPRLSKNGLVLIQNPIVETEEGATRVGVETKIYHKDGEWFDFGRFLLSFEKGSKMNLAQSAGSLTSYAKRYVITAVFSISTNEDTDGVYGKDAPNDAPSQAPQMDNQPQYDNYEGKRNFLNDSFKKHFEQQGITPEVYGAGMAARIGVADVFEADLSRMIETSKKWAKELEHTQQSNSHNQNFVWGQ